MIGRLGAALKMTYVADARTNRAVGEKGVDGRHNPRDKPEGHGPAMTIGRPGGEGQGQRRLV